MTSHTYDIDMDTAFQRLIPPSVVSESVKITRKTTGLLLTHQPLNGRFHHEDYERVSLMLSGCKEACVSILALDDDYSLTHTLYYVPEGSPERSVLTAELSIPEVELTGVCTLEREEMSVFLEDVYDFCSSGRSRATICSFNDVTSWLALTPPRHDYFEPAGLCLNGLDEEEYVGSLRFMYSLHLNSPRDLWIRHVGMDWPEYFFNEKEDSLSEVSAALWCNLGQAFNFSNGDYSD